MGCPRPRTQYHRHPPAHFRQCPPACHRHHPKRRNRPRVPSASRSSGTAAGITATSTGATARAGGTRACCSALAAALPRHHLDHRASHRCTPWQARGVRLEISSSGQCFDEVSVRHRHSLSQSGAAHAIRVIDSAFSPERATFALAGEVDAEQRCPSANRARESPDAKWDPDTT